MRVLAVAAHPDDVELLCAGTLALLGRAGHELWLAHMTVGDKGGQQPPDELARMRGEEAVRAAEVLGAKTFGGICGDLELYASAEHARRIDEILDESEPDVVITHALNDYHPDHRVTSLLVVEQVAARTSAAQPAVLYMDTVAGIDFTPELYCDVTATVEVKKEMLRCHVSQVQWMATYRHTDMEYIIEWTGRRRGLQCGARYAEGFRLEHRVGDAERSRRLLESMSLVEAGAA
jgi:LmbE family N-acetylglucosaminyl deacetylase